MNVKPIKWLHFNIPAPKGTQMIIFWVEQILAECPIHAVSILALSRNVDQRLADCLILEIETLHTQRLYTLKPAHLEMAITEVLGLTGRCAGS